MKTARTRLAVAVASSALLASGLGIVTAAATMTGPAAASAGTTVGSPPCLDTTVYSYGVCVGTSGS